MNKVLDELQDILINGNTEEVMYLRCPVCDGKLKVGFSDVEGSKSLGVRCESRCLRANFDGLSFIPVWVSNLGKSFTTSDRESNSV